MSDSADPTAMPLCPQCGAPLPSADKCLYDRPEEASPAHGDYDAMHKGLMTHAQHLLVVARWALHNPQTHSAAALERFRPVVREGWGRPQTLFPLDA